MSPDGVPFPEAVPFPVGPYTPEDFPEADVAAAQELQAELDSLREATYVGRDPDHIASAVVTGYGIVTQVRFAATAATRSRESLERAVVAAVAAAQARKDEAWQAAISQLLPEFAPAQESTLGGIEMAYETGREHRD